MSLTSNKQFILPMKRDSWLQLTYKSSDEDSLFFLILEGEASQVIKVVIKLADLLQKARSKILTEFLTEEQIAFAKALMPLQRFSPLNRLAWLNSWTEKGGLQPQLAWSINQLLLVKRTCS